MEEDGEGGELNSNGSTDQRSKKLKNTHAII